MAVVYCIKVDEAIVYVGKTNRTNDRVCQHWGKILGETKENKYQLLKDCLRRKHKITFWIVGEYPEEEIWEKESFWIHTLQPCLNSLGNCGKGKELTPQEFYDIIYNQEDEISGMYEFEYKPHTGFKTLSREEALAMGLMKPKKRTHRKPILPPIPSTLG